MRNSSHLLLLSSSLDWPSYGPLWSRSLHNYRRLNMKIRITIVVLALLLISAGFAFQDSGIETFSRKIKDHAIPLVTIDPQDGAQDLAVLKDVIGDAPIVLIGESQHLLREQYQLKHRITRFLVEEMQFTHIAIEDSFYGTLDINDYIKGAAVSPEESLKNTGGWYLWDTEEMLSLLHWLRSHNDKTSDKQKVSYVGIDIQDPWPGLRYLGEYFEKTDRDFAGYLESHSEVFKVFNQAIWFQIKNSYAELPPAQKLEIEKILRETGKRLESNREAYIKAEGEKRFRDCVSVVQHLLKSHAFFMELQKIDDSEVGIREKIMFENLVQIMESTGPQTKIIVWAHNAHAAKSPVAFLNTGSPTTTELELLGTMVKQKYGDKVKSIGMASLGMKKEEADFQVLPDVLDHVLSETGLDFFFLDFDRMKSRNGEKNPLETPWKLTADQDGLISLVPAKAFDGLFFIKYTTGVRPSPISAERFKKLF